MSNFQRLEYDIWEIPDQRVQDRRNIPYRPTEFTIDHVVQID